jgi:hypothetical protein
MSTLLDLITLKNLGIFGIISAFYFFIYSFTFKEWYKKNLLISFGFFELNVSIMSIMLHFNKLSGFYDKLLIFLIFLGTGWVLISFIYGIYVIKKCR